MGDHAADTQDQKVTEPPKSSSEKRTSKSAATASLLFIDGKTFFFFFFWNELIKFLEGKSNDALFPSLELD